MKHPHSSESASRPDNGLRVNRLAATVIAGACRYVRFRADLGFPIYGCGHSMRTGKDARPFVDRQDPLTVGSALNSADDNFRRDGDGVVVVSKDREVEILTIAEEFDVAEQFIRTQAEVVARLDIAGERSAYHHLQAPDKVKNKSMLVEREGEHCV